MNFTVILAAEAQQDLDEAYEWLAPQTLNAANWYNGLLDALLSLETMPEKWPDPVRMIAISTGFIELRRTQIELTEKNELLADLSSKLAKFLPPQLYNSIFTGMHTTRVAAKR